MKNKLLQNAMESPSNIKKKKDVTKDEVEVCLAYLNGKITARQYGSAIGYTTQSNAATRVATVLRRGIEKGWILIELL